MSSDVGDTVGENSRMVTRPDLPSTKDGDDLRLVVDAAREAVSHEFEIAERLDAKARNQMTMAGTWYAIVSTVAAVALRAQVESGANDWLFAVVVALAVFGGACLIFTMFLSYRVWRLQKETLITHEGLSEMLADAHRPDVDVAEKLVEHYRALLAPSRANNKIRSETFKRAVPWWTASLIFGFVELVFSLIALIQA
jgi:hypothetical protein